MTLSYMMALLILDSEVCGVGELVPPMIANLLAPQKLPNMVRLGISTCQLPQLVRMK